MNIGVISDTHGLVRPEAVAALEGSDLIIHAGDIGSPDVLDALRALAPVIAVRGNVDKGSWAKELPDTDVVQADEALIYVLHNLSEIDLNPAAAQMHAVIAGHSHEPSIVTRAGILYLNPGSAGPRRFKLPVGVARLHVTGINLTAELIHLDVGG